jgi:hypothetical protein
MAGATAGVSVDMLIFGTSIGFSFISLSSIARGRYAIPVLASGNLMSVYLRLCDS